LNVYICCECIYNIYIYMYVNIYICDYDTIRKIYYYKTILERTQKCT